MTTRQHHRRGKEPGLFRKHLNGDYSLARSYWLHTVLLGWGLAALGRYTIGQIGERQTMSYVSLAIIAFQPIALLVWMWSTAGTAMSAIKTFFSGGSRFWSIVTIAVLASTTFGMALQVAGMGPFLREHWEVVQGKQPTAGFSVRLKDGGRVIEFKGGVNEGAARALDKAIADAPKVSTIVLNSPGGWIKEGERMAQVIRRYQVHTHVDEECFSSCTLVFLAGLDRTASARAAVGFHRGRAIGENSRRHSPQSQEEADIYLRAGLQKDFVQKILATPHSDIWVPTRRELLQAKVLTR